jgi:CheY-like chemotaxis protein
MSGETKKRVFEPFFTTKGVNGTGLGLSVSYSIVEAHNGKIFVASGIGKGATFTIELPAVEPAETAENNSEQASPNPGQLSILVVDDDEAVREALEEMLVELDQKVVSVTNGGEALEKLAEENFDAVFTDLAMPEMDGWQLAREIRRSGGNIKIVLVTGYGEDVQPDFESGDNPVDRIIGKPFDFAQLAETLRELEAECGELRTG